MRLRHVLLIHGFLWLAASTCLAEEAAKAKRQVNPLRNAEAVVFRATFDESADADVGDGDRRIYTATSLAREESRVGLADPAVRRESTKGPRGGVLHFTSPTKQLTYFKGHKNLPYQKSHFTGTVSLWMKLSPREDLPKGYVDPLQITDKKWNDASIFIDFDQSASRPFRLGFFSDYRFWNPADTKFESIPTAKRPMIPVTDWPFARDRWTHVAFTWQGINQSAPADVTLYLNGRAVGKLDRPLHFTWDVEKTVIMLGINYVGWMDDLIIFNRALTKSEIQTLTSADGTAK